LGDALAWLAVDYGIEKGDRARRVIAPAHLSKSFWDLRKSWRASHRPTSVLGGRGLRKQPFDATYDGKNIFEITSDPITNAMMANECLDFHLLT
jgi:hypothetical protein